MRLNVYLAQQLGISRREGDRLIKEKHVKVNGKLGKLGQQIIPAEDHVFANGKPVQTKQQERITIALYKPKVAEVLCL